MRRPTAGFNMLVAAIGLCAMLSVTAVGDRLASIEPCAVGPVWRGWGTSLSWWAHVVGGMPDPLRARLCERVFRDLGLNIVRYEIGAGVSDGCQHMEPRAKVPCLLRSDGTYDWSADAGQMWVLQRACELGADTFAAFTCSPPASMTVGGSVTGAAEGASNLHPDRVDAFASHLARVLRHFRESMGIRFEMLSPMNEPEADWWVQGGRQAGCHVQPGPEQARLLESVRRALDREQVAAGVSAPECWSPDRTAADIEQLGEAASRRIDCIATHGYGGGDGRMRLRERADTMSAPLWVSEYGDGDASGLTMARHIVRDLRDLRPSAWCVWQAIDGGGGWGCIDLDLNARGDDPRTNRKFDMLAQFSHFIRPGARFLPMDDPSTVAAIHGDRLVLVTVGGEAADTLHIGLARIDPTGEPCRVVRSSAMESQVELPAISPHDGVLRLEVPPRCVVTVLVPVRSRAGIEGAVEGASRSPPQQHP